MRDAWFLLLMTWGLRVAAYAMDKLSVQATRKLTWGIAIAKGERDAKKEEEKSQEGVLNEISG